MPSPTITKLINSYAAALSNECIAGESEFSNPKSERFLAGKTEAARAALEDHIDKLMDVVVAARLAMHAYQTTRGGDEPPDGVDYEERFSQLNKLLNNPDLP